MLKLKLGGLLTQEAYLLIDRKMKCCISQVYKAMHYQYQSITVRTDFLIISILYHLRVQMPDSIKRRQQLLHKNVSMYVFSVCVKVSFMYRPTNIIMSKE